MTGTEIKATFKDRASLEILEAALMARLDSDQCVCEASINLLASEVEYLCSTA